MKSRILLAFATLLFSASVSAQTLTNAFWRLDSTGSQDFQSGPSTSQVSTSLSGAVTTPWTADLAASSFADYGILKASSSLSFAGDVRGSATSMAQFQDTFTISSDGLNGRDGVLHAKLYVNGSTSRSTTSATVSAGNANTQWMLHDIAVGSSFINTFESCGQSSSTSGTCLAVAATHPASPGSAYGVYDLDIGFTFGNPRAIFIRLETESFALSTSGVASTAAVDLGHSVYWGGITGVSVNGSPVTFSISSASGTDWTASMAPVPEPSTYAMLIAGLGLLGVLARRRRK